MFRDSPVSRRTVAAGAAWAVPAVAVAASAPSLAASTTCSDEMQILTQTFEVALRRWGGNPSIPGSATLALQVPTCVSPGDSIMPTLTATVTAAGFEEVYSGEGITGDFEFFYDLGVSGDPEGYRFWTDDLSLHRDDVGLGVQVSGQGEPVVVPATADEIVVGSNPFGLDIYFGDYEQDYFETSRAATPLMGLIRVA